MPSIVTVLLHPERRRPGPPPLRVDLRRVMLAGIALWTLALVVFLVLLAVGRHVGETTLTCVVGIALGGVGLLWEQRNRARYRGEDAPAD